MKKPTLVDVAKEAGVSPITVSRTLRDPDLVSKVMREKVTKAVEKLNFTPNFAAAALASNRSNIIGILIPSFSNNVFSDVLAGAYEATKNTRFTIQIGNTQYNQKIEEALVSSFLNIRPAGLLVTGIDQTDKANKILQSAPFPVVQIMDLIEEPIDMVVGFSTKKATTNALEHLLSQGYRKIGFIAADMDKRTKRRMEVYQQLMQYHGLFEARFQETSLSTSSVEKGRQLLTKLLKKSPDCDAVFCNNDDLAMGVMFECQRRGLKVPGDLAICGFNDLGATSQMYPSITSVHTPRFDIGKTAIEMVLKAEKKPFDLESSVVDLGFDLKVRESTSRVT